MNIEETEAILKLLRALDENPHMTQRQLSSHLGLSLGKINFLLKAFVGKGLVKIENFKNSENKIGYLYVLTPGGIEEKVKITYRFLKRKMREYETLEDEIRRLKKEIALVESGMVQRQKAD